MVTVPTVEDFADTTVMGVIRKVVDYICNTIVGAINTAQTAADAANTLAGQANTAAKTAQTTANNAQSAATAAQTDVDNLEAYVGTDTDLIPSS